MVLKSFLAHRPFTLGLGLFLLAPLHLKAQSNPSPTPIRIPLATPTPMVLSSKAVRLEVPFEKQEEPRDCGLAVLNMLSGYYGQKLNQTQVDWLKTNSQAGKGIMASELMVVLGAADFETALFQGTMDGDMTGLFHHLDKHHPLIVMITARDGDNSHYDLVTGYDPDRKLLLLNDPAVGPITVTIGDFQPAWERANRFTLLAVPKSLLAKTPVPSPIPTRAR